MRAVGELTLKWFKDLDLGVTTTWFLLAFVYLSGVSQDGPSVDFSFVGILPSLRVEVLNVALAIICLLVAAVALVEPALRSEWQRKTKRFRGSAFWHVVSGLHLLVVFILGLMAGIKVLVENLPTFSWLINAVAYAGLVMIVVMEIKMFVDLWSARSSQPRHVHG